MLGVFFSLEGTDEIICKPNETRFSATVWNNHFLKPQIEHEVQVDIGENRRNHAFNNVAKTVIEFLITISRERLRPQYGDGFRGAPLATSVLVQNTTRRNRGAIQDESGAKKETDTSGGTDV